MSLVTEDDRLDAVDHSTRVALVRSAVGDSDAVIESWQMSVLPGGAGGTNIKAFGEALSHGRLVPWSLVFKWFRAGDETAGEPADVDLSSLGFWKREWLLYQAPWFADWPMGFTAPRVLGAGETSGTDAWVAMEDLSAFDERPWSLRHFATFARQTGQFNGVFLAGHRLPSAPWLSRQWLRRWSAGEDPTRVLDAAKGNSSVARMFSDEIVAKYGWLWRTRDVVLQALDALPETLCHMDLHPRNAFWRSTSDGDQAVVIDWSYCGVGPAGADLAGLVGSSIFMLEAERISPDDLESECLGAYLSGLRDVGWRGSEHDVRFGYLASMTVRFSLSFTELIVSLVVSDKDRDWVEKILGRSIADFLNSYRLLLEFLEPRFEHVRQGVRAL